MRVEQTQYGSRLRVRDLELDALKRRATQGDAVLNLSPQEVVYWSTSVAMLAELR